ncbi:hypothetical protein RUM44_008662 [Polyplax serrata]|uniref:Uncharacterized protein n=1 Tax=Polyplax serrata TaxID=468196 RepID=A0ABR1BDS1_POLSC
MDKCQMIRPLNEMLHHAKLADCTSSVDTLQLDSWTVELDQDETKVGFKTWRPREEQTLGNTRRYLTTLDKYCTKQKRVRKLKGIKFKIRRILDKLKNRSVKEDEGVGLHGVPARGDAEDEEAEAPMLRGPQSQSDGFAGRT